MDYVCIKNFYDILSQDKISISESPYKENEKLQNALMISQSNNSFWLDVIKLAEQRNIVMIYYILLVHNYYLLFIYKIKIKLMFYQANYLTLIIKKKNLIIQIYMQNILEQYPGHKVKYNYFVLTHLYYNIKHYLILYPTFYIIIYNYFYIKFFIFYF